MSCRILPLIAILLVGSIKCQDVAVPNDLLPTGAPKTTRTTTTTTESPVEETTVDFFDDNHTQATAFPPSGDLVKVSDENGDDNLVEWRTTSPLNILPPSNDADCDLPSQIDPLPIPVPPIYQPTTDKPEHEIINQCPIGFILNGTRCMQQTSHNCPNGYEWRDEQCIFSQITCPLNFDFDGTSCVERQICPPNHVWKDNKCVSPEPQCPHGFRWNGMRCETITIQCQPGSILRGNECVTESITCPSGFTLINNQCIKPQPVCPPGYEIQESGFCSQVNIKCPSGSVLINGQCQRVTISCPPDAQRIEDQCYKITSTTTRSPIISPSPPANLQICPEGFKFYNSQCYRCPTGYTFCRGKCVKTPKMCENSENKNSNYPPLNINVNINFSRPIYYENEKSEQKKPFNIINNIEPINNTIINFNNVTHPVTLNNVNENNIYIYTETQCEDGSIRATIVKNNETITSCIDSEHYPPERIEMTTKGREHNSNEDDEGRCCEIVTPRQCKKRSPDQWICSHRRYKYCGKFCIADRLYMRPQITSFNNKVLTIAPAPQNHWIKPCYGNECPPVDCTGCMNGSFNCSPQCYTYPCTGKTCTYIDAEDFCENVGGSICR